MKDVMLSVRPEWCEKILSGEKTAELRKTSPKLEPPFRCHIYCTVGKPDLRCYVENIPETEEIFTCSLCGHKPKWGSNDDIHGSLWHCDVCGATFCEKCFIEEHGEQAFYEMLQSGEYIRCPDCLRKSNADVRKSLLRRSKN